MANWASTMYAIESSKETLQKIVKAFEKTKLSEEGYKWETDILDELGIDWENFKVDGKQCYLRGGVIEDSWEINEDNLLRFDAEEAWGVTDFKDILKYSFKDIKVYYSVEEPNEGIYATNDKERRYFPEKYYVDLCIDKEYRVHYFKDDEGVFNWLSTITEGKINNLDDVIAFNELHYDDEGEDENYIYIHTFKIVE